MGHTEHRQNVHADRRIRPERQAIVWVVPTLVALGLVCCTGADTSASLYPKSTPPPVTEPTKPAPQDTTPVQATAQNPVAPDFDQDAAWKMLVKQCDFGPRVPGTPAHIACRDYMLAELAKYTDNARLVEFTHFWSHNQKTVHMWNVIGEQNWKDAKVRVLLTAHWDSRPFSFVDENPTLPNNRGVTGEAKEHYAPIIGADDGASGIAVMLELAKEIKDKHPDVGIQFVLNDGEDLGPGDDEMYLGVTDYIKHQPTPKADYGILLDMIGNKGVHVPLDSFSYETPSTLPTLIKFYQNANAIGLGSTFPINDERSNVIDDNKTLTLGGVPTIDLIDFSYPYWHTQADTVDKCSPDALGVIGKALKSWFLMKPYYKPTS